MGCDSAMSPEPPSWGSLGSPGFLGGFAPACTITVPNGVSPACPLSLHSGPCLPMQIEPLHALGVQEGLIKGWCWQEWLCRGSQLPCPMEPLSSWAGDRQQSAWGHSAREQPALDLLPMPLYVLPFLGEGDLETHLWNSTAGGSLSGSWHGKGLWDPCPSLAGVGGGGRSEFHVLAWRL